MVCRRKKSFLFCLPPGTTANPLLHSLLLAACLHPPFLTALGHCWSVLPLGLAPHCQPWPVLAASQRCWTVTSWLLPLQPWTLVTATSSASSALISAAAAACSCHCFLAWPCIWTIVPDTSSSGPDRRLLLLPLNRLVALSLLFP